MNQKKLKRKMLLGEVNLEVYQEMEINGKPLL